MYNNNVCRTMFTIILSDNIYNFYRLKSHTSLLAYTALLQPQSCNEYNMFNQQQCTNIEEYYQSAAETYVYSIFGSDHRYTVHCAVLC